MDVAPFCRDWTGRFSGSADAVVLPRSTDEIAAVIAACADEGTGIIPQGGNTGLVGGATPVEGGIVLSLARFPSDVEIDTTSGAATVSASVTLGALQEAAGPSGWDYAVDFGSRDSATVGGSIATDAGGYRTVRYGSTRAQLIGIQAVLGDGSVVACPASPGAPGSPGTGGSALDLLALLCGSEGTLGVVTRARVRLVPRCDCRATALVSFASIDDACVAAGVLQRELEGLDALEIFFHEEMRLVSGFRSLDPPVAPSPAYLLVDAAGHHDPTADLVGALDSLAPSSISSSAVAQAPRARAELWSWREGITESISQQGVPHKFDVSLPQSALPEFFASVRENVRTAIPTARSWVFGHVARGNVHVNVIGVDSADQRIDELVLGLVADLGGSIAAEHGVGRAKTRWLHLSRSDSELAEFRAVKTALDPAGIMNPGVLIS